MSEEKEETKKPVSDSLRDWGIDVERFNERAKESLRSARGDLTEVTGTLRQTLVQAKEVVMGLQVKGSPAASELKQGFERAWQEIERAFHAARQAAREAQESQASASADAAPPPQIEAPAGDEDKKQG